MIAGLMFSQYGLSVERPAGVSDEMQAYINELIEERLKEEKLIGDQFSQNVERQIIKFIEKENENRRAQEQGQEQDKMQNLPIVNADIDHIRGKADAPFTIIEYSDYECPFCKRFHNTMNELLVQYPDQLNWVYRHYPLGFHNPGAQKQAEASECVAQIAGNDAFWAFSDALYERTRSNGNGFSVDKLLPLASEMGVDEAAFSECFNSERFKEKVESDFMAGSKAGVTGTPGSFLVHNASNTVIFISGAQPLESLKEALDQFIDQAG